MLHLVLFLCIPLALAAPPIGPWTMVLEDTFTHFNNSLWTKGWSWCTPEGCKPPVQEKPGDTCYFPDEAVYVEDGQLVLESKRQVMRGYSYTSGVVNSAAYNASQGFPCHFGYYEARIKVSPGGFPGLCPAFWFPNTVCPPNTTCEIDVEVPDGKCCGEGAYVWFTVHGNNDHRFTNMSCNTNGKGYCGDSYHVFGVLWQSDIVCFYYDDVEKFCTNELIPQHVGWMVFDNEIGLGGNEWSGYPSDNTPFPQKMYIDWVRAWKLDVVVT